MNISRKIAALLLTLALVVSTAMPVLAQAEIGSESLPTGGLAVMVPEEIDISELDATPETAAQARSTNTYNAAASNSKQVSRGYLSAAQQALYDAYYLACFNVEDCKLVRIDSGITADAKDAEIAVYAVQYDHPEIFWTGKGYVPAVSGGKVVAMGLSSNTTLIRTKTELVAAQARFEAGANEILAKVDRSGPPAVTALRVHDALISAIAYDYPGAKDSEGYMQHTAYNAFVLKTAVCDGYAKAYTYLLAQCGIRAAMVTSKALDHAWSLVELDGAWYETDATRNDTANTHIYYDKTTAEMVTLHRGSRNGDRLDKLLPIAYGTKYTYAEVSKIAGATPTPTPTTKPTPTPTAAPDYGTGVEGFVKRLYYTCLDRAPDQRGYNNWVRELKNHVHNATDAGYGFLFSPEFQSKNYCNEDFVKHLYQALMGREYDAGGLENWIKALNAGATREFVFNEFMQSPEFKSICAGYGVDVGPRIPEPVYGTLPKGVCAACGAQDNVTAFVIRLYDTCLDRKPDADGLDAWTTALWAHTRTGRSAATEFLTSPEFTGRNYNDEQFLTHLYRAFLGREPDTRGMQTWLKTMRGGVSRQGAIDGFAGSDEFTKICLKYGITRG